MDEGAILLGKSNMHELAFGATSNNAFYGPVRNPYDLTRIPGGSSGGTAAAIAARIVPLGLGTDTAGSVRVPAAPLAVTPQAYQAGLAARARLRDAYHGSDGGE
ncbi:MAG TPA: amidase family protein, partial [Pyrinomonadaceae bacterium]|nr:amidase family protein [Pyrinomonadaceae bacterium]